MILFKSSLSSFSIVPSVFPTSIKVSSSSNVTLLSFTSRIPFETSPKDEYSWANYKWCKGSINTHTKYCYDSNYGYEGFHDNLPVLDLEDNRPNHWEKYKIWTAIKAIWNTGRDCNADRERGGTNRRGRASREQGPQHLPPSAARQVPEGRRDRGGKH